MIFLIYTSIARTPMTPEALEQLLAVSQANNERLGVTGVLLYNGHSFVQYLEGPRHKVFSLMKQIEQDPRHQQVQFMLSAPITNRQFPDWSMHFPDEEDLLNAPPRALQPQSARPPIARRLLLAYQHNAMASQLPDYQLAVPCA